MSWRGFTPNSVHLLDHLRQGVQGCQQMVVGSHFPPDFLLVPSDIVNGSPVRRDMLSTVKL